MRGRRVVVAVALVCAVAAAVPAALAADDPAAVVDRSVTAVRWGAAAECRRVAPDDEQCGPIDGRPVSSARIDAYQRSWVHRALALQSTLDDDAPLAEALLPHTHNTFNSSAYDPTLTNQDPNQPYSITDQLNMDIRAIELDIHWVPSVYGTPETGGYWPTLCHGNSSNPVGVHVGCSVDRPLQDGLAEVAAWMTAHPSEFVLLYLEDQLGDSAQAHDVAGRLVDDALGAFAHPTSAPCARMDWTRSQRDIEKTGRLVIVTGGCSPSASGSTTWSALVHDRNWDESGDPTTYADPGSTQCATDVARAGTRFRRYFEDQTWVGAVAGSNPVTSSLGGTSTISSEATALMVRCGVNIIGFDQLTPEDPRLAALVWSWAPDEPAAGAHGCAYQGGDTRWRLDADCGTRRLAACVSASGVWSVTPRAVRWDHAAQSCATSFPGSAFAAPPNGLRNAQLAAAKRSAEVWVNVRL